MTVTWAAEPYPTLTITNTGWTDVDVSALVPVGTTGVIVYVYHAAARTLGVRNNGSADTVTGATYIATGHHTFIMGVDANRIFEFYVNTNSNITVRLYGWFTDESYFFVNKAAYTLHSGGWADVDVSAQIQGADVAVLAHFLCYVSSMTTDSLQLRCNGSGDDRNAYEPDILAGMSVGLDGSYICEGYGYSTHAHAYLAGYTKSGAATIYPNCTDYQPGATSNWTDMTALPAGALIGFFEELNASTSTAYVFGIRVKGGGDDDYKYYGEYYGLTGYPMKCDANRKCQGYITNTKTHFWLHAIAIQSSVNATVSMTCPGSVADKGTVIPVAIPVMTVPGATATKGTVIPKVTKLMPVPGAVADEATAIPVVKPVMTVPGSLSSVGAVAIDVKPTMTVPGATATPGAVITYIEQSRTVVMTVPSATATVGVATPNIKIIMPCPECTADDGEIAIGVTITLTAPDAVADVGFITTSITIYALPSECDITLEWPLVIAGFAEYPDTETVETVEYPDTETSTINEWPDSTVFEEEWSRRCT